jgi:membrane protease YdiL (CAAX protease family)
MNSSDPQNPFPPVPPDDAAPESSYVPEFPAPPQPPLQENAPQENFPEDIRTPWGGGELIFFIVFALVTAVVMEIFLALFMAAHYHITATELAQRLETDAPLAISFQAAWYVVIFAFLFIMIRVYHGAPFWDSLRWRRFRPRMMAVIAQYFSCIVGGVALAVAVGVASRFAGQPKSMPIEQLFSTRTDVLWLMVFGFAVAPFVEETIFRGFLYPVFARKWGIPAGIIITGVLFGLMHAPQLWPAYAQIGLLVVVGIVLTLVRARSGTVLASWLVHLGYNSFLFAGFVVGTHGLKNIPPVH